MRVPRSNLKRAMTIARRLELAVDLIEQDCRRRHVRFDYDTKIPYGVGVDLHVLPAYGMIDSFYPELSKDDWVKNHFSVLKTVGDIVDLMRVVLNESRDPSAPITTFD